MNYSDEEYVRLYTTDTMTWDSLPWQAIALLPLALRKFDRAGVFEFGKHGAVKALSVKTKLPIDVVEVGLSAILGEDIWIIDNTKLIWPTYIEAQTCRRSDRLRKRIERSKRTVGQSCVDTDNCPTTKQGCDVGHDSVTNRDICHNASEKRDDCRNMSHSVTPGEARERRGEGEALICSHVSSGSDAREQQEQIGSPVQEEMPPQSSALPPVARNQVSPAPGGQAVQKTRPTPFSRDDPTRRSFEPTPELAVQLFDAYRRESGKFGVPFDSSRQSLFKRLVHEGVTIEQVVSATRGAKLDPWACDEKKMQASVILGSAEQREKYQELEKNPPKQKMKQPPQPNDEHNRYVPPEA